MIDEYKTSQMCSKCETSRVSLPLKLRKRDSHGAYGDKRRCHTIVRCTNNDCAICWNRDVNASNNMLSILMAQLVGDPRPVQLRREGNVGVGAL